MQYLLVVLTCFGNLFFSSCLIKLCGYLLYFSLLNDKKDDAQKWTRTGARRTFQLSSRTPHGYLLASCSRQIYKRLRWFNIYWTILLNNTPHGHDKKDAKYFCVIFYVEENKRHILLQCNQIPQKNQVCALPSVKFLNGIRGCYVVPII